MAKFVSREKLNKRARKKLDGQKRVTWAFSPTTKKVENNRKKSARAWKDDFGMSAFILLTVYSLAFCVWLYVKCWGVKKKIKGFFFLSGRS